MNTFFLFVKLASMQITIKLKEGWSFTYILAQYEAMFNSYVSSVNYIYRANISLNMSDIVNKECYESIILLLTHIF